MDGSTRVFRISDALTGTPAPATSLAAEAWRRFRKHRLALTGVLLLGALAATLLVGPAFWRSPIHEIALKAQRRGPPADRR